MKKYLKDFFRSLLDNSEDIASYVDGLYSNSDYSEEELNEIFGLLKKEGLISCYYADNRAYCINITVEGKHFFDENKRSSRLITLIDNIVDIEKEFHYSECSGLPRIQLIYDSGLFQKWRQEVLFEIEILYSVSNDKFLEETIELLSKKYNGFNDKELFLLLKSKLNVIKEQRDYYIDNSTYERNLNFEMLEKKPPLVFISHSSKNRKYVELIVDLLSEIGLKPQIDVFCTSVPGYDIKLDTETSIFDFLREKFHEYDIHAFFIHSAEYYESKVCMNEMGAAWVLKNKFTSIFLPKFDFSKMEGVIGKDWIGIKLDADNFEVKDKLNQLKQSLEVEFNISPIQQAVWERKRDRFIEAINSVVSDT